MNFAEQAYTAAIRGARLVLPLLAVGEGKLARGVRGRRGALDRLESWASRNREADRPLVWFHAPSVGEGLQARTVMEEFRRMRPEAQVAYTYFSPSAESFARSVPADVADYLPLDAPADMRGLFGALAPSLVAFSKTEVWPNLTREAERRGVPALLLSATLPATSSRLRPGARALLAPAHRRLACVAAISVEDADRFGILGVPPGRRQVMGDARFDQVWSRAHRPGAGAGLANALRDADRLTIVAGSTWPPDEDALLRAIARQRSALPVRLILVPHEPDESHLSRIEQVVARLGIDSMRVSEWAGSGDTRPRSDLGVRREEFPESGRSPEVVVVDRVGVLGDLYGLANVAYVGGGFGTAGLHSVLEPAAFGAPVLFGPRYDNSREAAGLIAVGGGASVRDENELLDRLRAWLSTPDLRTEAGERARRFVGENLGAARRGAELICGLLDGEAVDHSG
jgi:3-deoxy-D-manno-octulosonic-acid transferase